MRLFVMVAQSSEHIILLFLIYTLSRHMYDTSRFSFCVFAQIKSKLSPSRVAFIPSFQLQSLIHLALNLICSLYMGLP